MNKRQFLGLGSAAALSLLTSACRHPTAKSKAAGNAVPSFTRCVSSAVLQRRLLGECTDGRCSDRELLTLAGLTRLDGFLIDQQERDLVLVGEADRSGSAVEASTVDWVVALRSATHRYLDSEGRFTAPGVTIEPQPSVVEQLMHFDASGLNQEGEAAKRAATGWSELCRSLQDVKVLGLPQEASHYLFVIEAADERMKSYVDATLATSELPGLEVPSRIMLARIEADLASGRDSSPRVGFAMSRYWFNAGTVRCATDDSACVLMQCDVRLSTEAQMLAGNKLADSHQRDELAERCAASLTRLLKDGGLPRQDPIYQALLNVYRAQAVAVAAVKLKAFQKAGLNFDPLLDHWQVPIQPVPKRVPGRPAIAGADFKQIRQDGHRIHKVRIPSCGGVVVDPDPRPVDHRRQSWFGERARIALAARPNGWSLYWDVPALRERPRT